ncbi:MAG: ferredoxin [Acidimicrobiaceae bacterium]|nr:ferredoxin [Acidimicrobiaceae bacterium]
MLRVRLDPIACDGYGYCAELLPEIIGRDDWGYPVLEVGHEITAEMLFRARRAVKICPRVALSIIELDQAVSVRS